MTVAAQSQFAFESTFVRDLEGLYVPWKAAKVPAPRLLALNEELAAELGAADPSALRSDEGVALLVGDGLPESATPVAQAYAGHQFGGYVPQLGDGRALLLGEVVDVHGRRRDIHLKGSGRTPFARGGDGKAAIGPMLREYVIGEAMHALGIPTTRALAVVATGEDVARETMLPGAILARVAASHIRVGTFEYARSHRDPTVLGRLADYSIARHHPAAAEADEPYLAFLDSVVDSQASLIAQWMLVGFIHGVMNTDNMAISGETIDYGPCAFMDVFDPSTVFSSIDHGGRYAYGNQPRVGHWNLARLAETLVPLIDDDQERAVAAVTDVLGYFPERFYAYWGRGVRPKLGFAPDDTQADALAEEALVLLRDQHVDYTSFFRALSSVLRGDPRPATALFTDRAPFEAWSERWREALTAAGHDHAAAATAMDEVNPVYIPRNHHVEDALAAATEGDMTPFETLVDVVSRPFEERPGLEDYAEPAPESFLTSFRTFCGT